MTKENQGTPAPDAPGGVGPLDRHVVVGALRLHYLDWGTPGRLPVVFLHGGGLQAHTWDRVCPALRESHHCYAVDLRGHGDSEWSPSLEYGLDAHARDLAGFLGHIGEARPVVVGHSLGGHAAIRYAAEHGDRLAGLVVVDTSPFVNSGPTLARLQRFILGASHFDTLGDAITYVRRHYPDRDPGVLERTLPHTLRQLPDGRWTWKRDPRHLGEQYFEEAVRETRALLPLVGQIRCPTLVVRGERGAVTPEDARRFSDLLPDGQMATVLDAGHNVQTENPAGLVDVLTTFLARLTAGQGRGATT